MNVYLPVPLETCPNYAAALRALGAAPRDDAPEVCGALLLPGGGDIHPRRYGSRPVRSTDVDEARDARELDVFARFAVQQKPVLGICRGMQLINVALGGTLRQHVEGHSRTNGADRLHAVNTPDPLLRELFGAHCTVNSAHHQAIGRLGAGLRAAQRADDGVIEAIRHETLPILAVQWHPERLCGPFARPNAADGGALLAAFLRMA